ncbi:MAG: phenylalanine--tRNA ligase subunit beta [Tissierellia bacterium]|nr:phenylalanine--tRNA ligase subunit beta [Tissierellia bacterium]
MLVPVNWMKKYIKIEEDIKDISDALTLTGSHVDSIRFADNGISGIVVGKILSIQKHPNADKLVVCNTDIGDREVVIVTGAKNVFEGAFVPVALSGAVLGSGDKIGNHDFRGVMSEGMFCSYEELGFDDSVIPKKYKDGILILKDETKTGTDIKDVLEMDDRIIEFEITPNRPDCLSIIGMARESAATFDKKIDMPEIDSEFEDHEYIFEAAEIDTDKCDNFFLRVLEDVKIEESPNWLQNCLMKAGVRPINNIVDITNFVMLEYGQPLHAYDLDKIEGKKLVVRQAQKGEKVKCIDSKERELTEEDIVIADEKSAVGIAGVMGGFDTEVTDQTERILLEAAKFDKESIRTTSKRLQLRSEASTRFEKGVAFDLQQIAIDRVATLARMIGAARPTAEIHKAIKRDYEPKEIILNYENTNKILGTEIPKEMMIKYLERLEFEVDDRGDSLIAKVPSFRSDISIEVDLIEEIGRMYGFHNIKPQMLKGELIKGGVSKLREVEDRLKMDLYALNYYEALSYSFISPKANTKSGLNSGGDMIELQNPLGEEFSVMRTSLIPNMLDILSKNLSYKAQELSIYELGNIFVKTGEGTFPSQKRRLCMGAYGDVDFYKIKADIKTLLNNIGIYDLRFIPNSEIATFHPGRSAYIYSGDRYLGIMGELSYEVSEIYDINKRAYITEFDVDMISRLAVREKNYKKIIKYPIITRDMALIVDDEISAENIEKVIREIESDIISDIRLFDIYKGDQIGEGKKSMAYQIVYQAADRTLVDDDVNEIQERIINSLESEYNISLRS